MGKPPGGNPQGITRDVSERVLEPRVPRGQDYVLAAVRSQEICMNVLQDRLCYESQGMRKRDRRKGQEGRESMQMTVTDLTINKMIRSTKPRICPRTRLR